jgi:hypothetical protein
MGTKLTDSGGFTLAEVVVAMFLLAGITVAMTVLPLTAKVILVNQNIKSMLKQQARGVDRELHSFVADGNYIASLPAATTGWALAYDSCTNCLTFGGGAGKCWALEAGCTHNVTSHLPSTLTAAPTNATMSYTINVSTVNGYQIRTAAFSYSYAQR